MMFCAGGAGAGALPVVRAAVRAQRARVPGHVHARRHARDPRVRGAGRHQCLHHHPCHGHDLPAHRQKVSHANSSRSSTTTEKAWFKSISVSFFYFFEI